MEANRQAMVGPPLPHVLEEELGEEILLYDSTEQKVISLNESAADIWRLCTGEFDLEGIIERMAGFYGVKESHVAAHVEHAVGGFIDAGLISPLPDV